MLPADGELPGWSRATEPESYDADTLWEYINGQADFFIDYGFVRVDAAEYVHDQDSSAVVLEIYESTTTSADGTSLPVFNKNRNSSNTPGTVISVGPTITDVGTQIKRAAITSPSGSSVVFSQSKSGEWILKPATKYLVRITNNSGGAIDFNITIGFYELEYDK